MIPRDHKKIITVDRLRLIDALRRAQLMSSETRGVKVAATKDGVTVTSDNPDLGEVREELEAEYNSDPIAIGFNPKYVVELLTRVVLALRHRLGGDPGVARARRVLAGHARVGQDIVAIDIHSEGDPRSRG